MSLSLKEENEHTHGMKYGVLPIYLYIYIYQLIQERQWLPLNIPARLWLQHFSAY